MDRETLVLMGGLRNARLSTDGTIKDVRADHTERYEWAAARTVGHVVDAGCNCGYGAAILADDGRPVTAIDNWVEGLEFAREHWDRPSIDWHEGDFGKDCLLRTSAAVIAFEVIEHLEDPRHLLLAARSSSPRLLASVPNEAVWPWQPRHAPVHHRHYTRSDFEQLLTECGWTEIDWWGQLGPESIVEPECHGQTLVVDCR